MYNLFGDVLRNSWLTSSWNTRMKVVRFNN